MSPSIRREPVGPGRESVWDYPRPPRLEPTSRHLVVAHGSTVIAASRRGFRLLETSHPPSYYLPAGDCDLELLRAAPGTSVCEWKGRAVYWDVAVEGEVIRQVAWSYPDPAPPYEPIRNHLAFYPSLLECSVDGERATPQPGQFYGGWVTSGVVGPFKGSPGTSWW